MIIALEFFFTVEMIYKFIADYNFKMFYEDTEMDNGVTLQRGSALTRILVNCGHRLHITLNLKAFSSDSKQFCQD